MIWIFFAVALYLAVLSPVFAVALYLAVLSPGFRKALLYTAIGIAALSTLILIIAFAK